MCLTLPVLGAEPGYIKKSEWYLGYFCDGHEGESLVVIVFSQIKDFRCQTFIKHGITPCNTPVGHANVIRQKLGCRQTFINMVSPLAILLWVLLVKLSKHQVVVEHSYEFFVLFNTSIDFQRL